MSGTVTRYLPMKAAGTQHFIERTYRESGVFQWVRETWINGHEADATRIEFGVEWQAVENLGVYRRTIADNGRGMVSDELVAFFNTYGGGGKPIGGAHENFGVGAKTSLMPWNRYGMVVISWVEGDPSMIWVARDPATGEYGLRVIEAEDPDTGETQLASVYSPYVDEEHGCDWDAVKPSWIKDHGTVIVLLGNDSMDDTVIGDTTRDEHDIKGISAYLNRRIWEVPRGVEIAVDELRTSDKANWPRSEGEAHGPPPKHGYDRRTNRRTVMGARYFIEYREKSFKKGKVASSGTVELPNHVKIDWYLWEGERPAVQSYAAIGGFIAALYKGVLYDVTAHMATYRSFGVSESAVRNNLWLIIRPPLLDDARSFGVYPRTDRNALLLKGGPTAGEPLPISTWAAAFADQMPDALRSAIKAARGGQEGTVTDSTWRERLAERFGSRWRIAKLRASKPGLLLVNPTQVGTESRAKPIIKKKHVRLGGGGGNGAGGRGGRLNVGSAGGDVPAVKTKLAGGIPHFRAVKADEVEPGILAAWKPNDPQFLEGVVLLNIEHPVLVGEIEYWQSQYPDHVAEAVGKEVIETYGQNAVAKVAHSEHLKGILPSETVENDLRSDAALTMSLLGLIAEDAMLSTRVGGRFGKRRAVALD